MTAEQGDRSHLDIVADRLRVQAVAGRELGMKPDIPVPMEKMPIEEALELDFATRAVRRITDEKLLDAIEKGAQSIEVARMPQTKDEATKPFIDFLQRVQQGFKGSEKTTDQVKPTVISIQLRRALALEAYLEWLREVIPQESVMVEIQEELLVKVGALSKIEADAYELPVALIHKAAVVGETITYLADLDSPKRDLFWKSLEDLVVDDPRCEEFFGSLKRGVEGTVLVAKITAALASSYGLEVRLGTAREDAFNGLDLVIYKAESTPSDKDRPLVFIDLKTSGNLTHVEAFTAELEGKDVVVKDLGGNAVDWAIEQFSISDKLRKEVARNGTPAIILRVPENANKDPLKLADLTEALSSSMGHLIHGEESLRQ